MQRQFANTDRIADSLVRAWRSFVSGRTKLSALLREAGLRVM
jgi:hypothetical protein